MTQRPFVVHRDLKPANVRLDASQETRLRGTLADFGIAGITDDSETSDDDRPASACPRVTQVGIVGDDRRRMRFFAETARTRPQARYEILSALELAPKYWVATRARLDPKQLADEIGPLCVPPPIAAATEMQRATGGAG